MRVPLAWCNLTHDLRRLVLAAGTVGFAVLLMFLQLGFWNALYDSTVALVEPLGADLVITGKGRYTMVISEAFPLRRIEQARAVEGVASAHPVYVEAYQAIVSPQAPEPASGGGTVAGGGGIRPVRAPIRLVAVDPGSAPFRDDRGEWRELNAAIPALKVPLTALADRRSRDHYGPLGVGSRVTVSGRRLEIIGEFDLGTDFTSDGTLIVGSETLDILLPRRYPNLDGLGNVDVGIVRLEKGADPEKVRELVEAALPKDVNVHTKAGFIEREKVFWGENTPIGFVFFLGLILGFIVGIIVCYQILATEISDSMPELATLKAMGYSPRFFLALILEECLYLATLGFVPGVLAAAGGYAVLAAVTGLPMRLTPDRMALVYLLTLGMCIVSGLLAIRRLNSAAPADLF